VRANASYIKPLGTASLFRENPGKLVVNLAKVGVEGSNPFARSKSLQQMQALQNRPAGPVLLGTSPPEAHPISK
jgi:hypothetical protein